MATTALTENIYDEIEIEDMTYDPALQSYHYPCPCGDKFEIALADLRDGEEIAVCPSCSLMIRVIFGQVRKKEFAIFLCFFTFFPYLGEVFPFRFHLRIFLIKLGVVRCVVCLV